MFSITCSPDLIDWKKVERRQVRERIDTMFHIMEKEYGVTRLLDPEGKKKFRDICFEYKLNGKSL